MPIAHPIVTGGSSGIGLALIRRLVARRVRVSVLALDDAALPALGAELGTVLLEDEEFERQLAVNDLGILWAVRAVAPGMVERRRGSIVAVSSFAGLVGVFGSAAYAPSELALRGLVETLRAEPSPHGRAIAQRRWPTLSPAGR